MGDPIKGSDRREAVVVRPIPDSRWLRDEIPVRDATWDPDKTWAREEEWGEGWAGE